MRRSNNEKTERNILIKMMRYGEGKTYEEIAHIFDISKARVQQILGRPYEPQFKRLWTKRNAKSIDFSDMTREDVLKLPGSKKENYRVYSESSHTKKFWANLKKDTVSVSEILLDRNIKNKVCVAKSGMPRIKVRTAMIHVLWVDRETKWGKSSFFNFSPIPSDREEIDFFVCRIPDDILFVIPSLEVPSCMRWKYPPGKTKKSKFLKFRERFDLLEENSVDYT